MTVAAAGDTLSPEERVSTIYPRYATTEPVAGLEGLAVLAFRDGTPYQGEDLFFDPAAQPGFVVRCSRPGAAGTPGMCLYERRVESADLTLRFPSDWLTGWRAVNAGIETLLARLKPG